MTRFRLVWNKFTESWIVDVRDDDGNAIVSGMALVTGANLLEQFDYLGLAGQLIGQTDNDINAVPTFDNLGTTGHVYWLSP